MQIQKCTIYNTTLKPHKASPNFGHGTAPGLSIGKRTADLKMVGAINHNIALTASFLEEQGRKAQALEEKINATKNSGRKPHNADVEDLHAMKAYIAEQCERLQRMGENLVSEINLDQMA